MELSSRARAGWQVAGLVALAFVFCYVNVLFFLFLIPMHVLYARRGRRVFLLSSLALLVCLGLAEYLPAAGSIGGRAAIAGSQVLLAAIFLAGLAIIAPDGKTRRLYRLLAAAGVAALASLPLVVVVAREGGFHELVRREVEYAVALAKSSHALGDASAAPSVDSMTGFVEAICERGYLFAYCALLAGMWRLSLAFVPGGRREALSRFAMPEALLWPVLAAWAIVLVDRFHGLGALGYAGWNAGLIGAFLYALQGVGVAQHLFERWRLPRGIRLLAGLAVVVLLLLPETDLVVLFALPIIGISELWINFGRFERSRVNEDHS